MARGRSCTSCDRASRLKPHAFPFPPCFVRALQGAAASCPWSTIQGPSVTPGSWTPPRSASPCEGCCPTTRLPARSSCSLNRRRGAAHLLVRFIKPVFTPPQDLFEPQTGLLRYVLEQPYSRDMVCNMLGLNKQVL